MKYLKSFEQYSENNTVYNINGKKLTKIPQILSDSITRLSISGNKLTSLPELPMNLKELYCNSNELISLPNLPNTLTHLDIGTNRNLLEFPTLPYSLISLGCDNCDLTKLPELPFNLKRLYCSFNKLTALLKLPESLEILDIDFNNVEYLPLLPDNLKTFRCTKNNFKEPVKYEYVVKFNLDTKIYNKDTVNKFYTFEFQKEFLENNPSRYENLIPFGYADGIKELFPEIFSAHDLGL